MLLTLMDHALRHRAQNADVACATPRIPAQAPARRDREAARGGGGRESRSGRSVIAVNATADERRRPQIEPEQLRHAAADLPHRRLAGFYFFYFAYLGAFAPFFSLYLRWVGRSAVEIGVLMALPRCAHRRAASVGLARRRAAARRRRCCARRRAAGVVVLPRRVRGHAVSLAVRRAAARELFPERRAAAGGGDDARASRRARPARYGRGAGVGLDRLHRRRGRRRLRARLDFASTSLPCDRAATLVGMLACCWRLPEARTARARLGRAADLEHTQAARGGRADRRLRADGGRARPVLHVLLDTPRRATATARR